jgi:hypothetical protein
VRRQKAESRKQKSETRNQKPEKNPLTAWAGEISSSAFCLLPFSALFADGGKKFAGKRARFWRFGWEKGRNGMFQKWPVTCK